MILDLQTGEADVFDSLSKSSGTFRSSYFDRDCLENLLDSLLVTVSCNRKCKSPKLKLSTARLSRQQDGLDCGPTVYGSNVYRNYYPKPKFWPSSQHCYTWLHWSILSRALFALWVTRTNRLTNFVFCIQPWSRRTFGFRAWSSGDDSNLSSYLYFSVSKKFRQIEVSRNSRNQWRQRRRVIWKQNVVRFIRHRKNAPTKNKLFSTYYVYEYWLLPNCFFVYFPDKKIL